MPPVEKGCAHQNHTYYCVETNTTWCSMCAGEEGTRVAESLRYGGWSAVMTPITQLKRLVNDDMARLRLMLRCVEVALAAPQKDALHAHPEVALEREAELCRKEIDGVLLRIVQHVQTTRDRLFKEVDAAVALRREAVVNLKSCGHRLQCSIREVENVAPMLASAGSIAEESESIAECVSAAQLLANVEERLVLDAETILQDMFPVASSVAVTRQLARRDVMTLPNRQELALLPFSIRLSKSMGLTSELDQMHVRDVCGARLGKPSEPPTLSTMVPEDVQLAASSAQLKGADGLETAPHAGRGWRPYQGLGAANARRRNIRTPDVL